MHSRFRRAATLVATVALTASLGAWLAPTNGTVHGPTRSAQPHQAKPTSTERQGTGKQQAITKFLVSGRYPQVGQEVRFYGWSGQIKKQKVVLQVSTKKALWKTLTTTRANRNGRFSATAPGLTRTGRVTYRAIVPSRSSRSREVTVTVLPKLRGRFTLVSSRTSLQTVYEDENVQASADLSTIVYGLGDNVDDSLPDSWWVRGASGQSRKLDLPIRWLCDVSDNGRYLLYVDTSIPEYPHNLVLSDLATGATTSAPAVEGSNDRGCGTVTDDGRSVAYQIELVNDLRTERVALWRTDTGQTTVSPEPAVGAHQWGVNTVQLSSDGSQVMYVGSASTLDPTSPAGEFGADIGDYVAEWDVAGADVRVVVAPGLENLRFVATPSLDRIVYRYWESANGPLDQGVVMVDVPTGATKTLERRGTNNSDWYEVDGISSDGDTVLYSFNRENGSVREVDLHRFSTGRTTSVVAYPDLGALQLSADGRSALFYGPRAMTAGENDGSKSDVYLWGP